MENNGKGLFYGVIGVATLVVAIIGATFAWFTATAGSGADKEIVKTGTLTLSYTDGEFKKVENLKPATKAQVAAAIGTCVDSETTAQICNKYHFTVENTGTLDAVLTYAVNVTQTYTEGALRYAIITGAADASKLNAATEQTFTTTAPAIAGETLTNGTSKDYTLVFWLDGPTATNEDQNKGFSMNVKVNGIQTNQE